jgi:hypothetical protein
LPEPWRRAIRPALGHDGQRLAQRHHRHAVARGEAAFGRQPVAGRQAAGADLDRQVLGDAQIGGQGAGWAVAWREGPPPTGAVKLLYH